ncbi:hypothetical protein IE53DRAFT_369541 [Violaceomyces palustris]|uniref:Uncharacterized protein n=1 Tax=Violaceomyces palustris TaxID=1673888 RepID=A0ACD0NVE0_9BASI|nr:hypothetical protein IE53DRAFT_369541 [Violaceomyces palustris]
MNPKKVQHASQEKQRTSPDQEAHEAATVLESPTSPDVAQTRVSPSTSSSQKPSSWENVDEDPLLSREGSSGRVISPSLSRPATRLDAVANTITSLSAQANRGWQSFVSGSSNHANKVSTESSQHATSQDPDGAQGTTQSSGMSGRSAQAASDKVVWSGWDKLAHGNDRQRVPVLMLAFASGGYQVLGLDGDDLREIVSLQALRSPNQDPGSVRRILASRVRVEASSKVEPQLLVATEVESTRQVEILIYSLATHRVVSVTKLDQVEAPSGPCRPLQAEVYCNERYLCVSQSNPAAIHILDNRTLQYLVPTITDTCSASLSRPPAVSLSGRLLAYTTTSNERDSVDIFSPSRTHHVGPLHPSRPRSHVQSGVNEMATANDFRENMLETSAQVGDVARRMGEGVLVGMRNLSSFLHGSSPQADDAKFSKSAPNLLGNLTISSVPSSPGPAQTDTGRGPNRVSPGVDASKIRSTRSSVVASCIRVVDLTSPFRTLASFSPSSSSIEFLSFSPNASLLLVADSLGHIFQVFEVKPTGKFGSRTPQDYASPVYHRYKLLRGVTSAHVRNVEWTSDAQWVSVGTETGTVHTYAINPYGGLPSPDNHLAGRISNPSSLVPLGVTLHAAARTSMLGAAHEHDRSDARRQNQAEDRLPVNNDLGTWARTPPSFLIVEKGHGYCKNSKLFAGLHALTGSEKWAELDHTPVFDILGFDPFTIAAGLHRLFCTRTSGPREDSTPSKNPKTGSQARGSVRSSGLTQMMRNAGDGWNILGQSSRSHVWGESVRLAVWPDVGRIPDTPEVHWDAWSKGLPSKVRTQSKHVSAHHWVSKAEIETYSQAPRVLPASAYFSRQFFFHSYLTTPAGEGSPIVAAVHRAATAAVRVREDVAITGGLASRDDDQVNSLGEGLASAIDAPAFDPEDFESQSPSSRIPMFPQGQRARNPGWRAGGIPIRSVAEGLGEGLIRAGRELGRGVEMARRRTNTSYSSRFSRPDAQSSLSFEGDEDDEVYDDARKRDSCMATSLLSCDSASLDGPAGTGPDSGSADSRAGSTETPLTGLSEGDSDDEDGLTAPSDHALRGSLNGEEQDWDSFTDREFGGKRASSRSKQDHRSTQSKAEGPGPRGGAKRSDDEKSEDFTVGIFDEEEPSFPRNYAKDVGHSSLPLVYSLRTGASPTTVKAGGSSLSSSGLTGIGDLGSGANSAVSTKSGTSSSSSGNSGNFAEGSKETHTPLAGVPPPLQTCSKKKTKKTKAGAR